ncbi:MAG: diacylglycerol kinase family protein [Candidatus Margulisbacteria bacterium]|nr:diacylglycerol kinase family protein [Candidatus Margulisiibacteriota bacterium]
MPKKFIKSFKYAKAGAEHAIKTQRNLWIHFFIGVIVLGLAVWFKVSLIELAILVLAIFGVIVAEMLNTSIEELVNLLSPEKRAQAGLAKNIAAAAVLLAAFGAVLVGALIIIMKVV